MDISTVDIIQKAANALVHGKLSTGFFSNGSRKLDFKVGEKVYTAIEQNPSKLSTSAQLAKAGHNVAQIKDVAEGRLIGNVVDGQFNSYDTSPAPVDVEAIDIALHSNGK